jgi:hypothetical protein
MVKGSRGLQRQLITTLGGTRRRRIPINVTSPTYAPDDHAAIHSRTGTKYSSTTRDSGSHEPTPRRAAGAEGAFGGGRAGARHSPQISRDRVVLPEPRSNLPRLLQLLLSLASVHRSGGVAFRGRRGRTACRLPADSAGREQRAVHGRRSADRAHARAAALHRAVASGGSRTRDEHSSGYRSRACRGWLEPRAVPR